MTSLPPYSETAPTRADIDALPGISLLEFGVDWCPHCQAGTLAMSAALDTASKTRPGLRHLRIEDGPGRPLGRSYRIKIWPTTVVLRDGVEVTRVVRPREAKPILDALAQLDGGAASVS